MPGLHDLPLFAPRARRIEPPSEPPRGGSADREVAPSSEAVGGLVEGRSHGAEMGRAPETTEGLHTRLSRHVPLARRADPATSHRAAESMVGGAHDHRDRILAHLRAIAPAAATKDEIGRAIGLDDVQVARRCSELRDAGLIVDSGETRPTATGRQGTCWRAK